MKTGKTWRFIETGASSAPLNMAIDEAITLSVMRGDSPPTLRLYSWDSPSVTIGYFQKLADLNLEFCESRGIPVVRRLTGGRAILHDDEITYSFSARESDHESFEGLRQSYEILSQAFFRGLKNLGLTVSVRRKRERGRELTGRAHCFESVSLGEILLKGRKIIGSAQKRLKNSFLQQGSIPLKVSRELYEGIFGSTGGSHEPLLQIYPALDTARISGCIREGFEQVFGTELSAGRLTPEEGRHAGEILAKKYSSREWREFR